MTPLCTRVRYTHTQCVYVCTALSNTLPVVGAIAPALLQPLLPSTTPVDVSGCGCCIQMAVYGLFLIIYLAMAEGNNLRHCANIALC